ncbi:MAG: hypothetical protein GY810_08235 [Aureispira sp.]|nr:hypothetical protein [Aureispira sp.]
MKLFFKTLFLLCLSYTAIAQPIISFSNTGTTTITEGTDCSFQDIVLDVVISMPATDDAVVNFNSSGTATGGGVDYDIIPASVTFLAGSTTTQQVTVRVYNDGEIEATESIQLDFNVL